MLTNFNEILNIGNKNNEQGINVFMGVLLIFIKYCIQKKINVVLIDNMDGSYFHIYIHF